MLTYLEYINENKYENFLMNSDHDEFRKLVDERAINMSSEEVVEIERYLVKYLPKFMGRIKNDLTKSTQKYEISTRNAIYPEPDQMYKGKRNKKIETSIYLVIKIVNNIRDFGAYIDTYKLSDDWFALSFSRTDGSKAIFYRCDEMPGLLNQIDELVEKYLS